MIKLKVKFTYLSRSQMLINLGAFNLYRFSIQTIDTIDKTAWQIRRSLAFLLSKVYVIITVHDISENSRSGGEEIE